MKLYKLTDKQGQTRNDTQWGENVTHSGTGEGEMCGPGYIHAYTDPVLAVMLNPIHANFSNPRLWEADGEVVKNDGLKIGCVSLTTLREIPLPAVTLEQRTRFGILCALEVYSEPSFVRWAERYLDGTDRSKDSAAEATRAATRAAWAAWAEAAAWEAAKAARAASKNLDFAALARKAVERE